MSAAVHAVHQIAGILWACRVSVLSLLLGWGVLTQVPQAQDLFLDLPTAESGKNRWVAFYVVVFGFWMLPLYLSAKVMLAASDRDGQLSDTVIGRWLCVIAPGVFAVLALVAIAFANASAKELIALPNDARPCQPGVSLACDAFLAASDRYSLTLMFAAAWGAVWILVAAVVDGWLSRSAAHLPRWIMRLAALAFGADRAERLHERARELRGTIPALIAAVALLVIWVASIGFVYWNPLDIWAPLQRAPVLPIAFGAWVPIATFFAFWSTHLRLPIMCIAAVILASVSLVAPRMHQMRVLEADAGARAQPSGLAPAGLITRKRERQAIAPVRQLTLREAISLWRTKNGCSAEIGSPCTARPLIVAAEGGASRAAFMTASTLGHLEDLSLDPEAGRGGVRFSDRIFAISSVSGGSLGAAVFASLRADSPDNASIPFGVPMASERPDGALWFGSLRGETNQPPAGWKEAAQVVLAGDFLTPSIAALGIDTWFPFHIMLGSDGNRAVHLERSFERRYRALAPSGVKPDTDRFGLERGFAEFGPTDKQWRPILVFNGTSVSTGRRILTTHLHPRGGLELTVRGVTEYEPVFGDSHDIYRLMCHSRETRLSERSTGTCGCPPIGAKGVIHPSIARCDVAMSTAVLNSARFPVISSHGDVRGRDGIVADRVVDGGYFDYAGIVTAQELATQINLIDDALTPYLLMISNDPGTDPKTCTSYDIASAIRREPDIGEPSGRKLFGVLFYPIDSIIASRTARSLQALSELRLTRGTPPASASPDTRAASQRARSSQFAVPASTPTGEAAAVAQVASGYNVIGVHARCRTEVDGSLTVRPVPMSWWLSMPVQEQLDDQMCASYNRRAFAEVMQVLQARQPSLGEVGYDLTRLRAAYDAQVGDFDTRIKAYCAASNDARPRLRNR